jgi:dTDP-4-dehydrorhamnose reductase
MSLYNHILITGGSGMLATAFKHVLMQRDMPFAAPPRSELDVGDEGSMRSAFKMLKPTLVLNCAAYTKVDLAEKELEAAVRVNGTAPGILARLCDEYHARLVHFSTDYVFDGSLSRPLKPTDPVGPAGAYGKSKLIGEQAIRSASGERHLICRTAWLYGPGGPNFVQTMLNAGRAGKDLKVIADQHGSPTYTRDLATAALKLLDARAAGTFHLSSSGQTNWFEFTGAILQTFGVTPKSLAPITSADWKAIKPDSAPRPAYSVLDTSDYTRATGQTMPHWRDALVRYKHDLEAGE